MPPLRFVDQRRSAIKQIASGRFGVTSDARTPAWWLPKRYEGEQG
mgnify:CR=1 FL=1